MDDVKSKQDIQANAASVQPSVSKDIATDIAELNEKIDKLTTVAEENHRMIKNLYQRARMATVFIFIKWFIIVGITIGSFYFIQPFINTLVGIYGGVSGGGSGSDLFNLIKSI
jgi:hypothetical protein